MDPRALQAAAAAAAAVASSGGSSGMVLDEATKNAMQYFLSQQYSMQQQPQATNVNDTFNLTQNALASGIPTLHQPTVMSYLGYSNSFQSNSKEQSFPAKYLKLLEVIEEIGRDVRPLYSGSKGANDRLRRQINQARHLARECLLEVDRAQR